MKLVSGKCDDARKIEVSRDLWLVPADARESAVYDAKYVVPVREDLPRDHPLYGQRVLKVVPAGSGDIVVVDKGIAPVASAASAEPPEEDEGVGK